LYAQNIVKKTPYPKIEKTVSHFLTQNEDNRLLCHFSSRATGLPGHRNLTIISLFGTLGQRRPTLSVIKKNDLSKRSFVKHLNKAEENG
jgi:hypothetical protein